MSKRISRVNQLLLREVSDQLRQHYKSAAVYITVSEVNTSPDLRQATVYYSVLGGDEKIIEAKQLFARIGRELQGRVSRVVTLKYFPKFEYLYDPSLERGAGILDILDQLDKEGGQ